MNLKNFTKVHEHILKCMSMIKHQPSGTFKSPFLSVTWGQHYGNHIYTWDNHHMSLRFAAEGEPEQMRFFLENMLSFQNSSGYVPCVMSAANGANNAASSFHAQPFLAQNAAVYVKHTGDTAFAGKVYDKLQKYLDYWLKKHSAPFGLYRWHYTYMSGFDNEIAGTIFQPDTIIPPDLNAWLYLEMRSMAYLAEVLNNDSDKNDYLGRAEKLKDAINTILWNEDYGCYAAYDLCAGKTIVGWGDGNLGSSVGQFAYLSCPALIPLFAGIAELGQAKRMIREYVLNPEHFRSPYGIRSLSKSSEYYNNARWGNPPRFGDHRRLTNSNWQGPVWIPLNWFVFHALLRYGFAAEAEKLAEDTFNVIALNLDKLGFMRENFHGETGEGLYADYFASWNILADLMPDYLPGGKAKLELFL